MSPRKSFVNDRDALRRRVFAVVSVGSTSVHLLVARPAGQADGAEALASGSGGRAARIAHARLGGAAGAPGSAAATPRSARTLSALTADQPQGAVDGATSGSEPPLPAAEPAMLAIPGTSLRLVPVADESEILGLGSGVDAHGKVTPEAERDLLALVHRYLETARGIGADRLIVIATEPLRRASNGAEVAAALGRLPGVAVHVLDHAEEAQLALLAARTERARGAAPDQLAPADPSAPARSPRRIVRDPTGDMAVLDVGGGTTEWAVVRPGRRTRVGTLAMGAARLTNDVAPADPPGPAGVAALREAAAAAARALPRLHPARAILLGGTASNLRVIAEDAASGGPPSVAARLAHARPGELDRPSFDALLHVLAREPADRLAWAHAIRPGRARILPAGAALLAACLERWSWPRTAVSEASIREGALVAAAVAGDGWRPALVSLVASLGAGAQD